MPWSLLADALLVQVDEEEFDDEDEEEEFETTCYMMQPVGGRTRQAMLKAAGVQVDRVTFSL